MLKINDGDIIEDRLLGLNFKKSFNGRLELHCFETFVDHQKSNSE
jgi:hypothetical protein